MRIFLTGGRGFIGRHLLPLIKDHACLCLSSQPGDLPEGPNRAVLRGDLAQPDSYLEAVKAFAPEACIHLGWMGLPDYSPQRCEANLIAGLRLFEALPAMGCTTLVGVGSCWEYGSAVGALPETHLAQHPNLFGAHKSALQGLGAALCHAAGMRFAWARPFFVFGPGQRPASLIPSSRAALTRGERPALSDPGATHDFIHVEDVARALRLLVETPEAQGIYNVGSGVGTPVWQVVNGLAHQLGCRPVYPESQGTKPGFWADATRLRGLGWAPTLDLETGLRRTLEAP